MEIADGSQSADHRAIGARSLWRVAKDARDGLDLLLSPRADWAFSGMFPTSTYNYRGVCYGVLFLQIFFIWYGDMM